MNVNCETNLERKAILENDKLASEFCSGDEGDESMNPLKSVAQSMNRTSREKASTIGEMWQ